ncbi:MAG: dethiobiotin synthase [Vicingus serpentipes]|nr:dethiobiotin synthase [Vicingus serpentipes]
MKNIFVTGIGTDVGKTIVSAILTEALEADYWKPVQAGDLKNSDTLKVQSLISNTKTVFHPETYQLSEPMSPHAAAAIDGIEIDVKKITLPFTNNRLVIEGAGGLMVPLNNECLIIDLIEKLEAGVVLVVQNYLGSINHTLLSIEVLKSRGVELLGVIFNGTKNEASESYILSYSGLTCLGRVKKHDVLTKKVVLDYKKQFAQL